MIDLAGDRDRAGVGRVEPAEDVQQRALAASGRTHHGDPLAGIHGERHTVEGDHGVGGTPEAFAQVESDDR